MVIRSLYENYTVASTALLSYGSYNPGMDTRSHRPQRHGLRFCKAFFEVQDQEMTRTRLARAGAMPVGGGRDDETWYWWQEPPRPSTGDRAAFFIKLRKARLVLEGPTAAAVGRGWRALHQRLEPAARARVAAGDDLGRFVPRPRRRSADRPETLGPEEERQVLREFYAAFGRRWARTPHAYLDGHTPAEARSDPELEPALEELLARMERLEDQRRARGMPSFSSEALREAVAEAAEQVDG